jgi:hypothetical protein
VEFVGKCQVQLNCYCREVGEQLRRFKYSEKFLWSQFEKLEGSNEELDFE